MIYQTYVCSMSNGTLEYGYCFKDEEDDDVCCLDFDLVIGAVLPGTNTDKKMQEDWKQYEWAAAAIVKAAPKGS